MSAFLIVNITVKNPEKFQEYAQQAGPTFSPYGGEVLIKGKVAGTYVGEVGHNMSTVIQFPNLEMMDDWYQSAAYQSIISLRDEAADVVFIKYAAPAA